MAGKKRRSVAAQAAGLTVAESKSLGTLDLFRASLQAKGKRDAFLKATAQANLAKKKKAKNNGS